MRSDKITEIAKNYHENLQKEDLLPISDNLRKQAINEALDTIPPSQTLPDPEHSTLNSPLSRDDIEKTLQSVKLGTAPGPDGIPYEVWKHLDTTYKSDLKNESPSFNVIGCLTMVINDIQTHGVDPATHFTLGHMCPIYKKKDRNSIQNYHLITLLNTDYKILTKGLATQLAGHALHLIHPDQTGFIPNRTIFDPIRLAQTMCAYADFIEEDGTIIALDQEKAYDKIDHQYLIQTLEKFNLPGAFIQMVGSLYNSAYMATIINGEISTTFKVV